jgi:uncharacterized RDD family membrane protein YckC
MNKFIRKHWCGEYSLARAYFVNGLLIDSLSGIIAGVAEPILEDLGEDRDPILAQFDFLWIVLSVWQTVGIWRSALRDVNYWSAGIFLWLAFRWIRIINVIITTFN